MDGSGGSPSKVMIMQLSGLLNTAGEGVTGVGVVYGVHLLSGYMKGEQLRLALSLDCPIVNTS